MELLQELVDVYRYDLPLLAAFALGLMTAISPCPLATNITATAYLSKNIDNKLKVLFNGIFYTLGRMFSYTSLGVIFYFGASQFKVSRLLQSLGGIWLGVGLLIIGILMLDIIKFNIPLFDKFKPKVNEDKKKNNYLNSFLLGVFLSEHSW